MMNFESIFVGGLIIMAALFGYASFQQFDATSKAPQEFFYDDNWTENGNLSSNMLDNGDYLEMDNNSGETATYQSDRIDVRGSIRFERIVVDMSKFDSASDTVNFRVRTWSDDGTLVETNTYSIDKEGFTELNVSEINNGIEASQFSYYLELQNSGGQSPQFDSVQFDTEITSSVNSKYGFGDILFVMLIFTGLMVMFSG